MKLNATVTGPDQTTHPIEFDLRPFLAGGLHAGLVQVELGSADTADSSEAVVDETAFPGTTFQQIRYRFDSEVTLSRTVVARPGYFVSVFDSPSEGASVEHGCPQSPAIWNSETFDLSTCKSKVTVCLLGRMEESKMKLDVADDRFVRLSKMREGFLIGVNERGRATVLRNIHVQAEAFWLSERAFALLNATRLDYSGRQILESVEPVSLEIDVVTGIATLQGTPGTTAILHGGNLPHEVDLFDGQTELEITGLCRKSDWWNVVMAAIQKL